MTTEETPETAAALDLLLTQAALGPLHRFLPGGPALRFARALAARPGLVTSRAGGLAAELARIAGGTSSLAPAARDRRFTDPAWARNPVLRRVMQAYLASGSTALGLVDEAQLDWRDAERLRFALGNLVDALAPSNSALLSPEAWKAALESGGGSLVTGARHQPIVRSLETRTRLDPRPGRRHALRRCPCGQPAAGRRCPPGHGGRGAAETP